MALKPHSVEFKRLIQKIEQKLLAQARLRTLLTEPDQTVMDFGGERRSVKARPSRRGAANQG